MVVAYFFGPPGTTYKKSSVNVRRIPIGVQKFAGSGLFRPPPEGVDPLTDANTPSVVLANDVLINKCTVSQLH